MPSIPKAFIVPGLPHLALDITRLGPAAKKSDFECGWRDLREAFAQAGEAARSVKPDVMVLYSAQWISVLGHSFQRDPNPRGLHVDENWYDMGDLPFDFRTDTELTRKAEESARQRGLATKAVNFEGFPIDTGTLVTLRHFNPDNEIPVVIVSSNIYCGREDSRTLGQAVGDAIHESGKTAVVVVCSSLSHRFITEDITPAADRIDRPEDDAWNRKMLDLIGAGRNREAYDQGETFAREAASEMGFKGFYWLMGVLGMPAVPGRVLAYGPVWGTGNAVIEYSLN